jgi:hypothetical protein
MGLFPHLATDKKGTHLSPVPIAVAILVDNSGEASSTALGPLDNFNDPDIAVDLDDIPVLY